MRSSKHCQTMHPRDWNSRCTDQRHLSCLGCQVKDRKSLPEPGGESSNHLEQRVAQCDCECAQALLPWGECGCCFWFVFTLNSISPSATRATTHIPIVSRLHKARPKVSLGRGLRRGHYQVFEVDRLFTSQDTLQHTQVSDGAPASGVSQFSHQQHAPEQLGHRVRTKPFEAKVSYLDAYLNCHSILFLPFFCTEQQRSECLRFDTFWYYPPKSCYWTVDHVCRAGVRS